MTSTKLTFDDLRIHSTVGGNRIKLLTDFSLNSQTLKFGNTDQSGEESTETGVSIELRTEIEDSLKTMLFDIIKFYASYLEEDFGEVDGLRVRYATNITDSNIERKEMLAFTFLVRIGDQTASIALLAPLLRQFKEEEVVSRDGKIYCGGEPYETKNEPSVMATLFGGEKKIPCYKISKGNLTYNLLRLDDGSYLLESSFDNFKQSIMI